MVALLIVLAAVVLLAVVLVARAFRLKPTEVSDPLPQSDAVGDDAAVERFREMLRCPTVWGMRDPDADRAAFDDFVPHAAPLYPRVFDELELEMIDITASRFCGRAPTARSVRCCSWRITMWSKPIRPAGRTIRSRAEVVDGKIYARGAVDTKCIWAASDRSGRDACSRRATYLRATCISSRRTPRRTAATPRLIWSSICRRSDRVPYMVLDEGGAIIDNPPLGVEGTFAVIGVAEKGIFDAHIDPSADGGHASTPTLRAMRPRSWSPVSTACRKTPRPPRLSEPVEAMLYELASHASFGLRMVFANCGCSAPWSCASCNRAAKRRPWCAPPTRSPSSRAALRTTSFPRRRRRTVNVRIDPAERSRAPSPHQGALRRAQPPTSCSRCASLRRSRPSKTIPHSTICAAWSTASTPSGYRSLRADQLQRRPSFRARLPAHVPLRGHPVQGRSALAHPRSGRVPRRGRLQARRGLLHRAHPQSWTRWARRRTKTEETRDNVGESEGRTAARQAPGGGRFFYGWWIVAGGLLIMATCYTVFVNCIPLFQTHIVRSWASRSASSTPACPSHGGGGVRIACHRQADR